MLKTLTVPDKIGFTREEYRTDRRGEVRDGTRETWMESAQSEPESERCCPLRSKSEGVQVRGTDLDEAGVWMRYVPKSMTCRGTVWIKPVVMLAFTFQHLPTHAQGYTYKVFHGVTAVGVAAGLHRCHGTPLCAAGSDCSGST